MFYKLFSATQTLVCPLNLCPLTDARPVLFIATCWTKSVDITTSQRFSLSTCTSLFIVNLIGQPLEQKNVNLKLIFSVIFYLSSLVSSYWEDFNSFFLFFFGWCGLVNVKEKESTWQCWKSGTLQSIVCSALTSVHFRETLPNHSKTNTPSKKQ